MRSELIKAGYSTERLNSLKWEKVIPLKTAKSFFLDITGRNLDLSCIKYARYNVRDDQLSDFSDDHDSNFLTDCVSSLKSCDEEIERELEDWFMKISLENNGSSLRSNQIIGFATSGGFLKGSDPEDNIFTFGSKGNIDIILGNPGAGKSTILDLLSLAHQSVIAQDPNGHPLSLVSQSQNTFAMAGINRAYSYLKAHSIDKYACYFHSRCDNLCGIHALFIDMMKRRYGLYKREKTSWAISTADPAETFPEMLLLKQNDITRAIERKDPLIFNRIAEEIDKALAQKKQLLVASYNSLINRAHQIDWLKGDLILDRQLLSRFIEQRYKEIKNCTSALENDSSKHDKQQQIAIYLSSLSSRLSDSLHFSLLELLNQEEEGLWVILTGPISDFIRDQIKTIWAKYDSSYDNAVDTLKQLFTAVESRLQMLQEIDDVTRHLPTLTNEIKAVLQQEDRFATDLNTFLSNQMEFLNNFIQRLSFLDKPEIRFSYIIETIKLSTDSANSIETVISGPLSDLCNDVRTNNHISDLSKACERINSYSASIRWLVNQSAEPAFSKASTIVDIPISLTLKQGSSFMPFEYLSYGQRSSILLSFLSLMTKANTVLIDQPEDHLDRRSTMELLAPVLKKISLEKNLLITTHNSALVMGLAERNPQIVILKSPLDNGGIQCLGNLSDIQVLSELFSVLEGGWNAWCEKIQFFKRFTDQLYKIEDDCFAEGLSKLRNALQPRLSINDKLKTLKHDLKNQLTSMPQSSHNSLHEVDEIISAFDRQSKNILSVLDNIKSIGWGANPTLINLFSLIQQMLVTRRQSSIAYSLDDALSGKECLIYANESDLVNVFNNLFNNSVKAIRDKRDGMRKLSKQRADEYQGKIEIQLYENQTTFLKVHFRDNGIGMEKDNASKLYKEKFTTRENRGGEGIGAMKIREFLNANQGSIELFSSGPDGTTQVITFRKLEVS